MEIIITSQTWTIISSILTILVIIGFFIGEKRFLFRLAASILIGVSAGVLAIMVVYQITIPRLFIPLENFELSSTIIKIIPIFLSFLLLFKLFPRVASLGDIPMGMLTGSAAAVLIGGVLSGTLFSQIRTLIVPFNLQTATANGQNPIQFISSAIFMLVASISVLAYFKFGRNPSLPSETKEKRGFFAHLGKIFIAISLGAIFAGVFSASLTALIERVNFLLTSVRF